MELILLIVGTLFGWGLHDFYISYKIRKGLEEIAKSNGLTLQEFLSIYDKPHTPSISTLELFTETHDDTIMLYNKRTNAYVGMGKSIEDLAKSIFDNKKISLAKVFHNNKTIWFVDGIVEKDEN